MFKDKEEVANLIQKVISEPEIIIKNPTAMSEKDYIAGKKLNEEKMGEVGVRKDENITKVFHANEKNVKKMGQLEKKEVVYKQSMVRTPTSYTQAQSLDERLVDNNISSNTEGIIPNNSIFSNFKAKSKEIKNHTQRIDQKINKNETAIQKNNQQTLENQSSQIKTKRKQR